MKARQAAVHKKKELYETAKARILKKEEKKAENELKRTIESMKGVY